MTRFEKYKRDLTVDQFTKGKLRACKDCPMESIGRCTIDKCRTETVNFWNEEVDDANQP